MFRFHAKILGKNYVLIEKKNVWKNCNLVHFLHLSLELIKVLLLKNQNLKTFLTATYKSINTIVIVAYRPSITKEKTLVIVAYRPSIMTHQCRAVHGMS